MGLLGGYQPAGDPKQAVQISLHVTRYGFEGLLLQCDGQTIAHATRQEPRSWLRTPSLSSHHHVYCIPGRNLARSRWQRPDKSMCVRVWKAIRIVGRAQCIMMECERMHLLASQLREYSLDSSAGPRPDYPRGGKPVFSGKPPIVLGSSGG